MKHFCCTICKKTVEYDDPLPALYPFCSKRCKMIDLGRWFSGQYGVDEEFSEDQQAPPGPSNDPQT